jgi:hypothetical protein
MAISAIGRTAAKAAMKKISDASAKKARAANKADRKATDFKAIAKAGLSDIKLAETTGRVSELFKKGNKIIGILPAAAGPGKLSSLSEKTTWNVIKKQLFTFDKSKSKKKSTECFRAF